MTETVAAKFPPFGLLHDAWGRLVSSTPLGSGTKGSRRCAAFPFPTPAVGLHLRFGRPRDCLHCGDLANLAPQVRKVLDEDLARREFVPVISGYCQNHFGDTEPCEWDVETDRGTTRFVLNSEDSVRRLGPYSGMIIDSHGIRYLIADMRTLNPASRQWSRRTCSSFPCRKKLGRSLSAVVEYLPQHALHRERVHGGSERSVGHLVLDSVSISVSSAVSRNSCR